jgi:hypothetical protein
MKPTRPVLSPSKFYFATLSLNCNSRGHGLNVTGLPVAALKHLMPTQTPLTIPDLD